MKKKPIGSIRMTDIKALIAFYNDLHAESDRAAVILGTSKLELLLSQILQQRLRPCPSSKDDIFEGEGPLSTLSSKINIAYRLGLIDDVFSQSLHIVRKIRNDFAHETSAGNIENVPHRDRVKALVGPYLDTPVFRSFKKTFVSSAQSSAKINFKIAISLFVVVLEMILCSTIQIKAKPFDLRKFMNKKSIPQKEIPNSKDSSIH